MHLPSLWNSLLFKVGKGSAAHFEIHQKKKNKMDKQRISKCSKMIATAESTWWVYLFARAAVAEYLSG